MEFIIDGNAGGEYDFESQRSGFNLMDGEGAADDIEAKMRLEASWEFLNTCLYTLSI